MEYTTKSLHDLRPADYNPRRIDQHHTAALHDSIHDFGDLSGITFNNATGNLVTGHQRTKDLMADSRSHIKYTERFAQPDSLGTIAIGYVVVDGTDIRLPYREVVWDETREIQANIIANEATGEFVQPLLAAATAKLAKLGDEVVAKTGQTKEKIDKLLKSLQQPEQKPVDMSVDSQVGHTYQLGPHKLIVGEGEKHQRLADQLRKFYVESDGGEPKDWAALTPIIAYPEYRKETPNGQAISPSPQPPTI